MKVVAALGFEFEGVADIKIDAAPGVIPVAVAPNAKRAAIDASGLAVIEIDLGLKAMPNAAQAPDMRLEDAVQCRARSHRRAVGRAARGRVRVAVYQFLAEIQTRREVEPAHGPVLAVDSEEVLQGNALGIGRWVRVARKIVGQGAGKSVVKGAIPPVGCRSGFIAAKDAASGLPKADAGKALKAVGFFAQVAVIRQAAVNAAPGFCPAFVKRKAGAQLPVEIAIQIVAVASVKIGAGGKLPAPPDIGGGVEAVLVLQVDAPIVGRAASRGVAVVPEIDGAAVPVPRRVYKPRFEQEPAALSKRALQGGIPVFARREIVSDIADKNAIAVVAAHPRREQARLPPLLDRKNKKGNPKNRDRPNAKGDGATNGFVVLQNAYIFAQKIVVYMVEVAGAQGKIKGVECFLAFDHDVGSAIVFALVGGAPGTHAPAFCIEVVAHVSAQYAFFAARKFGQAPGFSPCGIGQGPRRDRAGVLIVDNMPGFEQNVAVAQGGIAHEFYALGPHAIDDLVGVKRDGVARCSFGQLAPSRRGAQHAQRGEQPFFVANIHHFREYKW